MGKRNLSQNIKTGKEYRNNDNTNELKKKTNKPKKYTHILANLQNGYTAIW